LEGLGRVEGDELLLVCLLKDSGLESRVGVLLLICSQLLHQVCVRMVIWGRDCSGCSVISG